MNKKVLSLIFLLFNALVFSQVGIGTTTPSAALDVTSSNSGILIPRVALTAKNVALPVTNPQGSTLENSTLIFNTATAGVSPNNVTPGFYYWETSSASWKPLIGVVSGGWDLLGNSGTSATTNFLGTTDDNDLVFKRFNLKSGYLGTSNTSFGVNGLSYISTGLLNTAIGFQSLTNTTFGSNNTAVGAYSLNYNNGGYGNTANGVYSLWFNGSGNYNTSTGLNSMRFNNIGGGNTAFGVEALYNNSYGNYNTANGMYSLHNNVSGYNNVADGFQALYSNTSGLVNTALGYNAQRVSTSSSYNASCGANSIEYNSGNYNSALGYYAYNNGATSSFSNSVAIGYTSQITASNQIRIGNSVITSIGGQVDWTTLSDGRFKRDIQESVPGLEFIMKLRPVTYKIDLDKYCNFLKISDSLRIKAFEIEKERMLQTGFIAQEVEKAAQEINFDFSGVDKPKNDEDYYGLRYAEFTVPLVKAIQEQQKIIEKLSANIKSLEQKLKQIEEKINH